MKPIKLMSLVIVSLCIFIACNEQKSPKVTKIESDVSKIEVIDFHSTHRCKTCIAIESNTEYTLKTYFAQEMKEGKITFQTLNVEDNKQLAEKFEATGTSLFLNVISKGKETSINLTNLAFSKGRNKALFSEKLKEKIENELKKL